MAMNQKEVYAKWASIAVIWILALSMIGALNLYSTPTPEKEDRDDAAAIISSYDFNELAGEKDITKAASFVKGPYLQNVNGTAITISWEASESTTGEVRYGP